MKRTLMILVVLAAAACSGGNGSQGTKGDQGVPGVQGVQGPQGPSGADGISVVSASLPVGDSHCPTGGSVFSTVTGVSYACNGVEGAVGSIGPQGIVGPQGSVGPQGVQGPAGPAGPPAPGAIVVRDRNGTELGPSYGVMVVPMTQRDGYNIPQQPVTAPLATKTAVLLAEQPGGTATPRYLVWRTTGAAGVSYPYSVPLNCGFELLGGTVYYSGPGCTGTAFVSFYVMPTLGTACCYARPGAAECALVTSPSPEPLSGVTYWSRAEYGTYSYACQTQTAQGTIDYVAELSEVGPQKPVPAPLRLVAQ